MLLNTQMWFMLMECGISAILSSLLAIWLLYETLSNNIQYIGLGLIISGIFALNYGKIPVN